MKRIEQPLSQMEIERRATIERESFWRERDEWKT